MAIAVGGGGGGAVDTNDWCIMISLCIKLCWLWCCAYLYSMSQWQKYLAGNASLQLLSGHTLLNQHRARLDENVSEMCPVCLSLEDPEHFLFYCKAYDEEPGKMVEKDGRGVK